MKLSDVITPGDKIDIKMLHEANQEDNGGEIAKIYQSAVSDIFSDQELEISMPTSGGRMVLFQLERECCIGFESCADCRKICDGARRASCGSDSAGNSGRVR